MFDSLEVRALKNVKAFVDSYFEGSIQITADDDVFDIDNHVYSVRSIMGLLGSLVYEGLGLDVPRRN